MPIAVGDLVQNQTLISVVPSTTLAEALNIMIEHEFSQLPVLDAKKRPLGVVTSTSITRALLRFGAKIEELSVSDATVRVPDYPADEDLLYILNNILQHSVVLILDASKALIGILTEYDTTQYFRQRAEDIVLVESIERALKEHLLSAYDSTETESTELREAINSLSNSWDGIRKKTDSCLRAYSKAKAIAVVKVEIEEQVNKYFPKSSDNKAFSDLTLSEFIQLAQKNWQKLEPIFNIASPTWTKMIDEMREVRNKLVHFRGDISPSERHSLRFCADWFTAHPANQPETPIAEEITRVAHKNESKINNDESEISNDNITPNTEAVEKAIRIKYLGLAKYLTSLESTHENSSFYLNLSDIEQRIQGKLPNAAREQPKWWMEVSAHSQQWLETGWYVSRTHLAGNNPIIIFHSWSSSTHSIKESWQLVYWRNKLNCTEHELKDAIKAVGPESDLVEIHIRNEIQKSTKESS